MPEQTQIEPASLTEIWERFVAGEEIDLSALRPEIADSWRRCRDEFKVPVDTVRMPSREGDISTLDADLKEACVPVVDLLQAAISGISALVGISNREGELLHVLPSDARVGELAEQFNAMPGGQCSEAYGGTNCIGTGAIIGKPIQIRLAEHYLPLFKEWNTCSAPILHPINGSLTGVFGISGLSEVGHPRMIEFAVRGAELVSKLLGSVQAIDRLTLVRSFDDFSRRYQDAALLAVDAYGFIMQTTPQSAEAVASNQGAPVAGSRISELIGTEAIKRLQGQDRACELELPLPSGTKALANPVFRGNRLVGAIVVFAPSKRPPIQRTPKPEKTWTSHFTFSDIVGDSPALANAVRLATRAARTEHPVLVLGESGTGKEMFAHAIHDLSVRRAGPFVAFNFGALSEELTISEMCGHEPGAFTGATVSGTKGGIFDSAQGGTLFIDELQDAGPKAQSLLLRFVETHTFVRVGGTAPVQSDVRVIAASNNSDARLSERVRPDLLYRLNSITVRIPPLRERLEDIRPIAEQHLRTLGFRGVVDPEVWEQLMRYLWPGNVRELQNALLRATLNSSGTRLTVEDFPPLTNAATVAKAQVFAGATSATIPSVAEGENSEEVVRAMHECRGNVGKAAKMLGIHRSTLYRRLERLGIPAT
ncbi:MAG TPA: sigma 54-interacting transcriptional regulator [Candidatus Binataceae bacterium]|nr:sigma 54-interacting transcriptional regulator [Candidatus Binataceae bacterium]